MLKMKKNKNQYKILKRAKLIGNTIRANTSSSLRLFIPNRDARLRITRLYFCISCYTKTKVDVNNDKDFLTMVFFIYSNIFFYLNFPNPDRILMVDY